MTHPHNTSRLAWVDALRGYAIAAVIAYHAYQVIPGLAPGLVAVLDFGSMGVPLFFMISAFTIFLTLEASEREGAPIRAFLVRRAMRILPLFYLALLFAAARLALRPEGLPAGGFLSTLTFASAWIPSLCPTLVPGGWSIAAEMWFYLCAPFLARYIRTLGQAVGFAFAALALRAVLNEGLSAWAQPAPQHFKPFLYYWLPNHLPLFALGIVAYRFRALRNWQITGGAPAAPAPGAGPRSERRLSLLLLAMGLYLLAASLQGFKALVPFHTLFGLAFLLVFMSLIVKPTRLVANRPMAALGTLSYSAYISHFLVIEATHGPFLDWMSGVSTSPEMHFAAFLAWTLALTAAVSWVLHRVVELPGQALGKRMIARYL